MRRVRWEKDWEGRGKDEEGKGGDGGMEEGGGGGGERKRGERYSI